MRLLRGRAVQRVWGKSSECEASTDVRASSGPRKGVEGCVCPVLIEGTKTVVDMGLEGDSHYSVRRTSELEITRSLPSSSIYKCVFARNHHTTITEGRRGAL